MGIFYFALLILGFVGFIVTIWLAVHFMERCGMLGLPYTRSIRSVSELVKNPTDPKEIQRDAQKWLLLPDISLMIAILVVLIGDWDLVTEGLNFRLVPTIFIIYILLAIFSLAVLLPARRYKGKRPPLG